MEDLFKTVREECSPGTWSKGVELARRLSVTGVSSEGGEILCRVKLPERMVPATVRLYPDDEEWDCDCNERSTCCEHVAAAVIAVRKAQGAGQELPVGRSTDARLIYRLERKNQELSLTRVLVNESGERPLRGTLASAVARKTDGIDLTPSQQDLSVDRLLSPGAQGLHRDRVWQVLKLLEAASNVELDGTPVYVSSETLKPTARVVDAPDNSFLVEIVASSRIDEVVASGIALCGQTLHRLVHTEITGLHLENLPNRKTYTPAEISTLVTEVLPELRRRFDLTVETQRLPALSDEEEPRLLLEAEQEGDRLSILATLVYGDPPIARIDRHRMIHLQGPIPVRKQAKEERLTRKAQQQLGLSVGKRVFVAGDAAVALAERLDEWPDEIQGSRGRSFIQRVSLTPRFDGPDAMHLTFGGKDEQGRTVEATAEAINRAWQNDSRLVPLVDGGWATLPANWLENHGDTLATFLEARAAAGSGEPIATHGLPALAELYAALDQPAPAELSPLLSLVRGLDQMPRAALPADLNAELRSYQRAGVDWLALVRALGMGATLADDMGLGKTLQTICVLGPGSLVVCPTSVVHNWAAELQRFRPGLTFNVYRGKDRSLEREGDVVLTSYAILRRDLEQIGQRRWKVVVLDEAQAIKNPESQSATAAFSLKADFRITLSGTPVENRLEELWSQFHFTNRGLLGGRSEFQERFAYPIANGDQAALDRLRKRIGPFLLRRDKKTVAPELPPRTDLLSYCELSRSERELYDALKLATQKDVVQQLRAGGSVMQALEALLRLRQAACHPGLLPGKAAPSSAKLDRLVSSLDAAQADGHKALVFSQWTRFLDLVEPALQEAGISFTRLDGSTVDREGVVNSFQSPDGPSVILLSLKAGGTGLNLTAADHVFMLDLWWNPAVEQQAADRAHRIGQTRPVFVHRLIARDTVEERILLLQEQKRALAENALMDASQASNLGREDLLALLE